MWKVGFSGVGFTRDEFKKWLASQKKPTFARFLTVHNSAAPYIKPSVLPSIRIKNLANYYRNEKKWSSGPHFFVIVDRVYGGTPPSETGTHSPSWNGISLGIECEGDYRTGKHSPFDGDGKTAWDTMAWVFAELLTWLGWEPTGDRIKLHREDGKTTHACPGNLIDKTWFLEKVQFAMGRIYLSPSVQLFDMKEIQERLIIHGFDLGKWGADGINGQKTDKAIRAHQTSLQISPTGTVGPWQMGILRERPKGLPEQTSSPTADVPVIPLSEMHISKAGLDMIKHFEGLRLAPYDDVGSLAIGYGHSNRSNKLPVVTIDLRITEAEAEKILASDLIDYENRVKASITLPVLKQHQFDALVSISYNWGPGNLDRSELKKMVNAGSHVQAAAEIRTLLPSKDKKHYAGILRRRNKEADLYGWK